MRRMLFGLLVLVGMSLVTGGCGTSTPAVSASISLPSFQFSCSAVSVQSRVISVREVDLGAERRWMVAGVCVQGRGPFPFVIDTGAPYSVLDKALALALRLPPQAGSLTASTFGCSSTVTFARLDRWSAGSSVLPPTTVVVGALRSPLVPGLSGVVGSDVLSRYGVVRFDSRGQTVTLGEPGPRLGVDVPPGTGAVQLPGSLTTGTRSRVGMAVRVEALAPGPSGADSVTAVQPSVIVTVAGRTYPFIVDTGAAGTEVSPSVARQAGLVRTSAHGRTYDGFDCQVAYDTYSLPAWRVGSVNVPRQTVRSSELPADGLLGWGTLRKLGPVILDYRDGELLLGGTTRS